MLNPISTRAGTHPGRLGANVAPRGALGTRPTREFPGEVSTLEGAPRKGGLRPGPRSMMPVSRHFGRPLSSDSRLTKDTAHARAWLYDGAPLEDVVTVIEVRRRFELSPDVARRYATKVVRAAAKLLRAQSSNPSREETFHAAA
jgi:hypothetical protein